MGLFDIFGGAITSAWSSAAHDESQEIMNKKNIDFQRETNQMNERLWRDKFDYDKWQYLNTLAYNSKEAREAFEREAKWNSPFNQMAELRKAGINPFSVFGQNGSVASAHSSPASGANNSSSAPPQMIAPQMQYSYQNSGLAASLQMVDAVTKVIDSLSSSKLKGSQKKEIDTLLGDKLAQLKAQTQNEEALAQINKLEASFKETFGMLESDARYQKLVAESSDLWQSIALKISQGELIDEQKLTEQSKRMLNDIEAKLKGEQKRLFKLQADNYLIVQAQNIKESNSRIEQNRASASASRASAATQNEIRPYVSRINAANARIMENDAAFKDETFVADVEKTMDNLQQMGIITQTMQKQLDLAIKENNWYVARQIIGLACDISNSASQWIPKVSISRESRSGSDDIRGNYYEEKNTRNTSRVGR